MTRYPIEAVAAVPFGHACSLLEEVAAIVDRVTFNAHIIETGTRSYRLAASFLIVERTTDPSGHTYAQALRRDDGSYLVEHRDGDAGHHYGTIVADMRTAHQLLTGWAFQLPGWSSHATWSQIRQ